MLPGNNMRKMFLHFDTASELPNKHIWLKQGAKKVSFQAYHSGKL